MIKSIHIHNYKSLRDVTVALEPVTVLIGRSGSGKSNFVDALRFLREYLTQRNLNFISAEGGWPAVICATGWEKSEKFSIEINFDIPEFEGDFKYALSFMLRPQHKDAVFHGESLTIDGRMLFEQCDGRWNIPPQLVAPPNPSEPALGILYGIQEAKIAHLALTSELGCYDFPGDALKGGQFNPANGTSLDDNAKNYLTAFDGIVGTLAGLNSVKEMYAGLRKLNKSVTTVELADRSYIKVGHQVGKEQVLTLKLHQESEGFRRFLAHLIALYQRPGKQILVFEEPEKGIYPGALAVLVDYFRAFANRGRTQVILTTHSPELLSHFGPQQIRAVEMKGYETKIGPVAPEQLESLKEGLMTAGELLTVDEARIDPAATTA